MESTLHRQLKTRFGTDRGGRLEVAAGCYRADALGPDGEWIEVQSGSLGPLRPKLQRLLLERPVRVIKPVVVERKIVRRARREGRDLSARLSPKRGALVDVFDDLVGLARLFPHPHLTIDVLAVAIDEVRLPRRRWPGYSVADRVLREVRTVVTLAAPEDLWKLLPDDLPGTFTTLEIADRLDRPVAFAQRVAYCLRHAGAAEERGKVRNRIVYGRAEPSPRLNGDRGRRPPIAPALAPSPGAAG